MLESMGYTVDGDGLDADKRCDDFATLDSLRPQGEWLEFPEDWRRQIVGSKCSLCGFAHFGMEYNYCPNCGAKMKGADNNA